MKCAKCNNIINKDDKFCDYCGAKVDEQIPGTEVKKVKDGKFNLIAMMKGMALSVLIGVLIIGFVVGGRHLWFLYQDFQNERAAERIVKEKEERIKNPKTIINQSIQSGNWGLTVQDVRYQEKIKTSFAYSKYAKGVYMIINIKVQNISKTEDNIFIGDESFQVLNEKDAIYNVAKEVSGQYTLVNNFNERITLGPGFDQNVILYYDVPSVNNQYRLIFQDDVAIDLGYYVGIGILREYRSETDIKPQTIKYIVPGSPAETAGMKIEDTILKINNLEFNSDNYEVLEIIYGKLNGKLGDKLKFDIMRGGETLNIEVELGKIENSKRIFSWEEIDSEENLVIRRN